MCTRQVSRGLILLLSFVRGSGHVRVHLPLCSGNPVPRCLGHCERTESRLDRPRPTTAVRHLYAASRFNV
jgi:hypothetical protein